MKKTPKQIAAIVTLVAFVALIIAFFISALTTKPGSSVFYALLASVIAVPILGWICVFVLGRVQGKHSMAELFPESMTPTEKEINEATANSDSTSNED